MNRLKIAIVFPVFNGLNYTKKCLKSLFSHFAKCDEKDVHFDVVITNDGSSDGSSEWIRDNFPQVHILEGNGNLWWSGGINLATSFAINDLKSDYILWWNNDVLASDTYFSKLTKLLKKYDTDTILGSKIFIAGDRDTIWSMGGEFNSSNGYKQMIGAGQKDGSDFQDVVECDWLTGMGTITHKAVYEKIGMIDEVNFPQYHGDSDFTLRAKKSGFKVLAHPDLKMYNDITHTGLKHSGSFRGLFQSLVSIKSNYNIKKDFKFYSIHAGSLKSYKVVFNKYFRYIGGFMKWKLYSVFGIKNGNMKKDSN